MTHRDLKLENIIFDDNKNVHLIDFGFSTCVPYNQKLKIFCGTPSYMCPEIVMKKEYLGPPTDIWACGILLYALLCGQFPFKSPYEKDLYKRIARGIFAIPESLSPEAKNLL